MINRSNRAMAPPRISEFAVGLFVAADVSESIIGDLQEEFSSLSVRSGPKVARTWYRRQVWGTILHSMLEAFRSAAFPILLGTFASAWFIAFATRFFQQEMRTALDARRIYEVDPSAYLFWLKFPLEFGRAIVCALAGASLAFVLKNREMPAGLVLALFQLALFSFSVALVVIRGHMWLEWFLAMVPWNVASAFGTILGAATVRLFRRPAGVPQSSAG